MKYRTLPTLIVTLVTLLYLNEARAGSESREGLVVAAGNGSLTMTQMNGQRPSTHIVVPNARISLDGKRAKLEDLQIGDHVWVTTRPSDTDKRTKVIIRIDAVSVP